MLRLVTAVACFLSAGLLHASITFVGSGACKDCHAGPYAAWSGSHHQLAMQAATPDTVLGDFANAEFTYNGITSRFFTRDGTYYVRTDGADGSLQDFAIGFTFGVTPLQQYLVAFPDGRMQALNIAWDSRPKNQGGQRWFHLHPDEAVDYHDELHWTGAQYNWNFMCADCHSTQLVKGFDAVSQQFNTTWSEISVGCEACHGPGSGHIAWAGKSALDPADATRGLAFLLPRRPSGQWAINAATGTAKANEPARSSTEIEVCASCHSRRGQLREGVETNPVMLNHYMPALLTEGLYHADGQIQDEVYVWGSFTQSRMYAAGVSCSDCHDPHNQQLRAPGDAVCAQCHLPATFAVTGHHGHAETSPGANCLSCHMPETTYMLVDPRRDHSLRIPRPDLSQALGTPNACSQCHADRSADWLSESFSQMFPAAAEPFQNWAQAFTLARSGAPQAETALLDVLGQQQTPEIARATAARELRNFSSPQSSLAIQQALRDESPLVRFAALEVLELAPPESRFVLAGHLLQDPLLAVRVQAGRVLAGTPRQQLDPNQGQLLQQAVDEYVDSQKLHADRAESLLNLAILSSQTGDTARAEKLYRDAIHRNPQFASAWINLAELYRSQGLNTEAVATLNQGIAQQPRNASLHHALGLALVRGGNHAAAVAELGKAATLQPDNARFAYVYGIALNSTQRQAEALRVLAAAHKAHPSDRQILFALATINRDSGHLDQALIWTRTLLQVHPSDQHAHQLLAALQRAINQSR